MTENDKCIFCLGKVYDGVNPCDCKESVHPRCVLSWITEHNNQQCSVCKQSYKLFYEWEMYKKMEILTDTLVELSEQQTQMSAMMQAQVDLIRHGVETYAANKIDAENKIDALKKPKQESFTCFECISFLFVLAISTVAWMFLIEFMTLKK